MAQPQRGSTPRERHEARSSTSIVRNNSSPRQNDSRRTRSASRGPTAEDESDEAYTGRRPYLLKSPAAKSRDSQLEAENASLRAEVSELRRELRGAVRELTARTLDLQEVSSLLTVRQSRSASQLGDGISSDGLRSGHLSGICAEALVSRSSIIARLEADNDRYRAKVAEQDRMLLELHSEMQTQTREVQSLINSRSFAHAEAEMGGRGRTGSGVMMAPAQVVGGVARGTGASNGALLARGSNGALVSQARSDGSLITQSDAFTTPQSAFRAPQSMPSPRIDGRMLR